MEAAGTLTSVPWEEGELPTPESSLEQKCWAALGGG